MTREKLVEIIRLHVLDTNAPKLADKILAALDQERKGEVVIGIGHVDWFASSFGGGTYGIDEIRHPLEKVNGKRGTLIFREDK